MNKLYCFKCRQKTDNVNPLIIKSRHNRKRLSAKCKLCKKLKSGFIK